jgi:Zn-dependent peptidase ImmA (M78 family)/transcriptional regulator with XRE-family HTH domain
MTSETVEGLGKSKAHVILGAQLRKARETVGFRPEEVAERLGIQSDEISRWETEQTKPSLRHLECLAELYGREIDYFLKQTPSPPTQVQFRSITRRSFKELSEEARFVIAKFDELCRTALELERTLGKIQPVSIEHAPSDQLPADLARKQRNTFRLGEKPVVRLRDDLMQKGVRIFQLVVPPGQFSGFSYWHPEYGPCILINAKETLGRRNFTTAHEYAHLLYGHPPSVCDTSEEGKSVPSEEERLANAFTIEFLLPAAPIAEDFSKRDLSRTPSIQEIGNIAGRWRVSVQAMLYRLEHLGLIEQGHANYLLSSYQPPHPRAPKIPRWERRLGKTFVSDAVEAYHKGDISLGKLAHCLDMPLRKALDVADTYAKGR